jgi:hypothetical protein
MDLKQTLAETTHRISFLSPLFLHLPHTRSGEETHSFVATLMSFTSTHRQSVAYAYASITAANLLASSIFFITLILFCRLWCAVIWPRSVCVEYVSV